MPRRKIIPDQVVFASVRHLLIIAGDKGATFGAVARATGLAAPTLVQRFGSQDGMVRAALIDAWDTLTRATDLAEGAADLSPKGGQGLLKSLVSEEGDRVSLLLLLREMRDPVLRDRATAWRAQLEQALSIRLGGGARGRDAAALLFAAWQGQILWESAGGRGFRLKEAVRRLT